MRAGRALIRRLNFSFSRRVSGRSVRIPVLGGLKVGMLGERFLLDILCRLLPELDGAFIDVGANLGQTLCKVKLADPGRRYFGFEPNAACHAYLEALTRCNAWSDVTIFPFGLSDRTSIVNLHVRPDSAADGRGSLLPDARPELDLSTVKPAVVFDFAEIESLRAQRIAFLKIDVEGAELEVVRSMADTLRRDRPVVSFELMPRPRLVARHEKTLALLRSLGYEVSRIAKGPDKAWAGVAAVDGYSLGDESESDFIAVPRHLKALVDDAAPATRVASQAAASPAG